MKHFNKSQGRRHPRATQRAPTHPGRERNLSAAVIWDAHGPEASSVYQEVGGTKTSPLQGLRSLQKTRVNPMVLP